MNNGMFDSIINGITNAAKWMSENKEMTNLLGNVALAGGSYFAQKEMAKNALKQQREMLAYQDELKQKYSAVPDSVDTSYGLVFDDAPNLANGGILTSLKKQSEKGGV